MATQKQLIAAAARALGSRGGQAYRRNTTPQERSRAARRAAQARWARQRQRDKEAAK